MYPMTGNPLTQLATRVAQCVSTLSLLTALVLAFPAAATAQVPEYVLRVCNEGNVDASVALIRQGANLFLPSNSAEGWWRVRPNSCEILIGTATGNGAWVAFIFQDHAGVWRSYHSTPKDAGVQATVRYPSNGAIDRFFVELGNQMFCVSWTKFSSKQPVGDDKDLRECPAGASGRYRIPFTAHFRDPTKATTFTIKPDANGPGRPIEGASNPQLSFPRDR